MTMTSFDRKRRHLRFRLITGVSLGSVLAVTCSWQRNRSILWAILAGIFSWFYVIYFALTRQPEELK